MDDKNTPLNSKTEEQEQITSHEHAPSYEHVSAPAPSYNPISPHPAGLTLVIDPSATFIKMLPDKGAPPLYTLNRPLLKVSSTTSIHVARRHADGRDIVVYAIAEHFLSPLTRTRDTEQFQDVFAARSHGALVTLGGREKVWDFSVRIPAPPGADGKWVDASERNAPVDPVYTIGTSPGPGTVKKSLLEFERRRWVNEDDEVVAIERDTGEGSGNQGMPVLSVQKELSVEWLDFLVSAWCVTLWGELDRRVRRFNHQRVEGESWWRKFRIFGKEG